MLLPNRLVAIGCMRLSTAADRDEARALDVLHAALDAGVTLFDTANAYCLDANGNRTQRTAHCPRACHLEW